MTRLKQARKNAGKTVRRTAIYLDTTEVTLRSWEAGASEPRLSQAAKLANFYGCTLDDLAEPLTDALAVANA